MKLQSNNRMTYRQVSITQQRNAIATNREE